MTERALIQFTCKQRGHVYASVVDSPVGREVVIPRVAYTDTTATGTARVKRLEEERRIPIIEGSERWAHDVLCGCGYGGRRLLTLGHVEIQIGEWQKFNARSSTPRRVVLDTTIR